MFTQRHSAPPRRAANEDFEATTFAQAADLIRVYPDGTPAQQQALIDLYPRLSPLDLAHLLSDPELAPKLEKFGRAHRSTVRTPMKEYWLFLVIAIFGLGLIGGTSFIAN
jgi:hypothetical protein